MCEAILDESNFEDFAKDPTYIPFCGCCLIAILLSCGFSKSVKVSSKHCLKNVDKISIIFHAVLNNVLIYDYRHGTMFITTLIYKQRPTNNFDVNVFY